MAKKTPYISPAITDVPLRQTLQSMIDNSSSESVVVGNGPPPDTGASGGTPYYDASSNNLYIFNDGAYRPVQPKVHGSMSHDVGSIDISELTSSEVAYYWDLALQENTGEYKLPVDGDVFILISTHSTGSNVYVYNGSGKILTLNDDNSTQVDTNSWYRQASYIPGNLIVSRSLSADAVEADFINSFSINASLIDAGTINASRLQLNGNAQFTQGGGISFNKPNATSENNGLFFGSTSSQSGADDFTFYASNEGTGSNNDKRSVKISKDELTLVNPTIKIGNAGVASELYASGDNDRLYTANATIAKDASFNTSNNWGGHEILKISLVGGGGGGGSSWNDQSNGASGGNTTVTINWEAGGTTVLTAAGGAGGPHAAGVHQPPLDGTPGGTGLLIPHGGNSNGGAGGVHDYGSGSNGSGVGSGGGGAGGKAYHWWRGNSRAAGSGGSAGAITTFETESNLVASLTIAIGGGGSGGTNAGNGTNGAVKLYGASVTLDSLNLSNIINPPYDGIGTYVFGKASVSKSGNQELAGSSINASDNAEYAGSTLSGTWKCMGHGSGTYSTLWTRIA